MTSPRTPKDPPRWLLFAVWCCLGAPLPYYSAELVSGLWQSSSSTQWAQTEGRVVQHTVRGRGFCFTPRIHFEYMVRGERFESSTRVPLGLEDCLHGESAHRLVEAQPPGSTVRVYYDQTSPRDSVLLPGYVSRNAWMGIFLFPIMFVGWLYCARLLFKSKTPTSAA